MSYRSPYWLIVVVLAIAVFVWLAFKFPIWLPPAHGQDPIVSEVPTAYYPAYEEHMLAMEREALDAAYKAQLQSLFLVWLKDSTGQPARAKKGINQAKAAYVASMDAIERREETGSKMITRPPGWKP